MIEAILKISIIATYMLSFVIYISQLIIEIKRFKPRYFREYVIILAIFIGSIVPILNSLCAIKIIKDKRYE